MMSKITERISTSKEEQQDESMSAAVVVPVATTASAAASSEQVDFIGPSNAVKGLFTLPYSLDKGVSVAVHNMNGTLLIDADASVVQNTAAASVTAAAIRKRPRPTGPASEQTPPPRHDNDAALALVTSMLRLENNQEAEETQQEDANKYEKEGSEQWKVETNSAGNLLLPPPEHYATVPTPDEPREYLSWKFRGLNLMVGSDALVCRHPEQDALAIRFEDTAHFQALVRKHADMIRKGQFVADYSLPQKSYADALAARPTNTAEKQKLACYATPDLSHVKLQTCLIPSSASSPLGSLLSQATVETSPTASSPVCTVMDAYLDNIIANVPQLALCLREKGFIQSVKLLKTEQIPSSLLQPWMVDMPEHHSSQEPIFSPQIMEMNASTLLRFLKSNCSKDNATYLLRREAGQTNVQLFDVTAISASRQRKWNWWLAMMSYRFAIRLGQLEETNPARKRQFRARQRSLLSTSLELLQELSDMDGGAHETLSASIEEHLADTFLNEDTREGPHPSEAFPAMAAANQPYECVSEDSLNKAHDHLANGTKLLWTLLHRTEKQERESKEHVESRRGEVIRVHSEDSSSEDESDSDGRHESDTSASYELQSISMQLFGLLHKSISVSLRLAEYHLQNYLSSSSMRDLRSAARRIADAITLLPYLGNHDEVSHLQNSLQCQYIWLWEHCGHFARSFAADELWRDRGHACGDDVISVLRDSEAALSLENTRRRQPKPSSWMEYIASDAPLSEGTHGSVSLQAVSAVVDLKLQQKNDEAFVGSDAAEAARNLLKRQRQIQRDKRRVLVAACISYSRAIDAIRNLQKRKYLDGRMSKCERQHVPQIGEEPQLLSVLQQRLGDGCNEIGKILLSEVRSLLSNTDLGLSPEDSRAVPDALLHSADFWFSAGLRVFQECRDVCNVALLRCNLCQCSKLRANSNCSVPSKDSVNSHAEACLQQAAEHLQLAHETLCERDVNPRIWDMVSEELAATFLVLGVRRRQALLGGGTMPVISQSLRLPPGLEKSIVDPMERALEIYSQLGNAHQAAASNYQLALFYSKVWTCQRDESRTRNKLSKAFEHFGAAHAYFSQAPAGNESTFVILSLDLANLYAVVSGNEGLSKALSCCLNTCTSFSFETIDAALERRDEKGESDWFEKMSTLASSLEEQVFKFLVSLVKIEKEFNEEGSFYRELYRCALKAKMAMKQRNEKPGTPDHLSSFHELLVSIKEFQE